MDACSPDEAATNTVTAHRGCARVYAALVAVRWPVALARIVGEYALDDARDFYLLAAAPPSASGDPRLTVVRLRLERAASAAAVAASPVATAQCPAGRSPRADSRLWRASHEVLVGPSAEGVDARRSRAVWAGVEIYLCDGTRTRAFSLIERRWRALADLPDALMGGKVGVLAVFAGHLWALGGRNPNVATAMLPLSPDGAADAHWRAGPPMQPMQARLGPAVAVGLRLHVYQTPHALEAAPRPVATATPSPTAVLPRFVAWLQARIGSVGKAQPAPAFVWRSLISAPEAAKPPSSPAVSPVTAAMQWRGCAFEWTPGVATRPLGHLPPGARTLTHDSASGALLCFYDGSKPRQKFGRPLRHCKCCRPLPTCATAADGSSRLYVHEEDEWRGLTSTGVEPLPAHHFLAVGPSAVL